MKRRTELFLHRLFEIGILLKFIDGIIETIAGILIIINAALYNRILGFLFSEFLEDARYAIANLLAKAFSVSLSTQVFASVYLLLHGIVKICLVIGVWKRRLWVYPVAGVVLGLFMLYQAYLVVRTHSLFQIALTIIDLIILVLLRFEYLRVKRSHR